MTLGSFQFINNVRSIVWIIISPNHYTSMIFPRFGDFPAPASASWASPAASPGRKPCWAPAASSGATWRMTEWSPAKTVAGAKWEFHHEKCGENGNFTTKNVGKMGISPRKMWGKWGFHHEKCGQNGNFTTKNVGKMGISPWKMWGKCGFHHEKCGQNGNFTTKNVGKMGISPRKMWGK